MVVKNYSITIQATKEKVWQALWQDENYRNWTSVFCAGSYAKTDNWQLNTIVHFLDPKGRGMYSKIVENVLHEKMVFEHIGEIENLLEKPIDDATKIWSGNKEAYYLLEENNCTTITVVVDVHEPFMDFFESTFPKALQNIKAIAESIK